MGQVVHVMGRVTNTAGEPVKGARIEIWQANTHGRYAHPGDDNPAPLDPNFQGYASLITDGKAAIASRPSSRRLTRLAGTRGRPHIHFDVVGKSNRVITQMYFPGDQFLEKDSVVAIAEENARLLIADMRPPTPDLEPDSLLANWNIVLENG